MNRTLTPREEAALPQVVRKSVWVEQAARIGVGVLGVGIVGGALWMAVYAFDPRIDTAYTLSMAALVAGCGGLAVLLAVRTRGSQEPPEVQLGVRVPLVALPGPFRQTHHSREEGVEDQLWAGGVRIVVPKHWPRLPSDGVALAWVPSGGLHAGRRASYPRVIEVVGWRSLDDDLRTGAVRPHRLRYRATL